MSKLEAYYGLPNEVKFCKKCDISNQRPSSTIEFKSDIKEKSQSLILMIMEFVLHILIMRKKKLILVGVKGSKSC
jgi:hypothetical protein